MCLCVCLCLCVIALHVHYFFFICPMSIDSSRYDLTFIIDNRSFLLVILLDTYVCNNNVTKYDPKKYYYYHSKS